MTALMAYGKRKYRAISELDLTYVEAPEETRTWQPVKHSWLLGEVIARLAREDFKVTGTDLRISKNDLEFFGILWLQDETNSERTPVVGVRNTNNKRASAGVCMGTNVTVCSNLDFYGEHILLEKHLVNVYPKLIDGIRTLAQRLRGDHAARLRTFENWKQRDLSTSLAHNTVIAALDVGAILAGDIPKVLQAYRFPDPGNPEARGFTPWALYNAFTWVLRDTFQKNPDTGAQRSIALNRVFDNLFT